MYMECKQVQKSLHSSRQSKAALINSPSTPSLSHRLDLAHSRATADATGTGVSTTTGRKTADDGGGEESCECEPEERGGGLSFTAARGGATGDDVGVEVALEWIVSQL